MSKHFRVISAAVILTLGLVTVASADPPPDSYQIRYVANLDKGDSVVNLTNTGTLNGYDPAGRICAQIYVFNPNQTMAACCSCPLTPNHLRSLSVKNDLVNNPLTPGTITTATIAILATSQTVCGSGSAAVVAAADLAPGLRAWGTTLHALPTAGTYALTETEFSQTKISASELNKIDYLCAGILALGSGHGICGNCADGALGAARQ